ncbi:MAG TPA: 3-phosphoshikimate 1-carboxyvinyltransferase [Gemmatimonadaceae bacterium]|nr:3-phosphoshikimate 1-carboxyvinyltransferase [Gemmatimonadaceae bacterium]
MRVAGTVQVPGDKSISHRALLLAALADGPSRIRNILPSADVHSTAGALRALGVDVPALAPDMTIVGRGLGSLRASEADLDCGNSGTTTRLLSGIAAACPFASRFTGDASLSRRPMQRVARPLTAMGARIEFEGGDGLPMVITGGSLHTIEWSTRTASAQTKSAILLAGLVAGVPVTVREPARSRDHTERMLGAMGVGVTVRGTEVQLAPAPRLDPLDMTVPADPSSAAFLTALAVLAEQGELTIPMVCLNETRTGFFRALARMGARLELCLAAPQGGDVAGAVLARPSALTGIELDPAEVPSMIDELPLLACIAARAEGTTTISGAAELRVKESDRIAVTVANLRAVGIQAEELPDGMRVMGSRRALRGAICTHGDHRIAMAFGILAALPGNEIAIDDPGCVTVSYPDFWHDLRRVVAG